MLGALHLPDAGKGKTMSAPVVMREATAPGDSAIRFQFWRGGLYLAGFATMQAAEKYADLRKWGAPCLAK